MLTNSHMSDSPADAEVDPVRLAVFGALAVSSMGIWIFAALGAVAMFHGL